MRCHGLPFFSFHGTKWNLCTEVYGDVGLKMQKLLAPSLIPLLLGEISMCNVEFPNDRAPSRHFTASIQWDRMQHKDGSRNRKTTTLCEKTRCSCLSFLSYMFSPFTVFLASCFFFCLFQQVQWEDVPFFFLHLRGFVLTSSFCEPLGDQREVEKRFLHGFALLFWGLALLYNMSKLD